MIRFLLCLPLLTGCSLYELRQYDIMANGDIWPTRTFGTYHLKSECETFRAELEARGATDLICQQVLFPFEDY
jgi:hypothetical protein